MADDHHDAGPLVEVVLEGAEGVEVEVVRRFVQQQDVRLLDQREQQLQPPSLAARERADGGELRVTVEPEAAHQSDVLHRRRALVPRHGITHALREVEVAPELVVVADADGASALDGALCGHQPARDDLEQRALAGPVRPDDADPVPRLEREGDAAQHVTATRLPPPRHPVEFDALAAEALAAE